MPRRRSRARNEKRSGLRAQGSGHRQLPRTPTPPGPTRSGGGEPRTNGRLTRAFNLPIGCGVDVVELDRFIRSMKRGGARFMRRIFTPHEEAYARARRRTTALHLAGRFAAKEAIIKAISQVSPSRVPAMNRIEIRNDQLGRPRAVLLDGRRATLRVYVSLSHVDTVAVASAIVVRR